jgi:hypothetical protein
LIRAARERDPARRPRGGAVGWLLAERPFGLSDARFALAMVERLPHGRESRHRLARRR